MWERLLKRNVKIAIIADSLPFFYNSGVGTVILECIAAILAYGWEVVVIGPDFAGSEKFSGIFLPSIGVGRGYRVALPFNSKALREQFEQVDVVHIHSVSPIAFQAIAVLSTMKNPPRVIWHLHTQLEEYLRVWGLSFLTGVINHQIMRCLDKVDLVLVPSDFFRDIVIKSYGHAVKIKTWAAPINLPENIPEMIKYLMLNATGMTGVKDDTLLLQYIGRISIENNIPFLMSLMNELEDDNVGLVLVGGGDINRFEKMLTDKARTKVGFLGQLPRIKGLAYCRLMDYGVTPTVTGTQGLGLLEQMARYLPVIAPSGTCYDQPIKLSRGGDSLPLKVKTWAESIRSKINDRSYASLYGENASEYVLREYSVEGQRKKLIEYYKKP